MVGTSELDSVDRLVARRVPAGTIRELNVRTGSDEHRLHQSHLERIGCALDDRFVGLGSGGRQFVVRMSSIPNAEQHLP